MPLDITFRLSDRDLNHFQAIVDRGKAAIEELHNSDSVEVAARQIIKDTKSIDLPDFIGDRLEKLDVVVNMLGDKEWQLGVKESKRVLGALVYFCDPEDLIPDHLPGLGFIDDAIYVEIVIRELQAEIESYEEFCAFRLTEENRRKEKGQDPHVKRDEWLAEKRAALHKRMHRRGSGRGWHLRW